MCSKPASRLGSCRVNDYRVRADDGGAVAVESHTGGSMTRMTGKCLCGEDTVFCRGRTNPDESLPLQGLSEIHRLGVSNSRCSSWHLDRDQRRAKNLHPSRRHFRSTATPSILPRLRFVPHDRPRRYWSDHDYGWHTRRHQLRETDHQHLLQSKQAWLPSSPDIPSFVRSQD